MIELEWNSNLNFYPDLAKPAEVVVQPSLHLEVGKPW